MDPRTEHRTRWLGADLPTRLVAAGRACGTLYVQGVFDATLPMLARLARAGVRMAIGRFYWVIEDALAGCSRPGGAAGPAGTLDDDLRWLRGQGIGAVLSLTERPVCEAALAEHGLVGLHLPVADLTAPSPDQFLDALQFIDEQRARQQATVAHCKMGQGRA